MSYCRILYRRVLSHKSKTLVSAKTLSFMKFFSLEFIIRLFEIVFYMKNQLPRSSQNLIYKIR